MIVMFQGYAALNRAVEASPSPEAVRNKKTFTGWALAYICVTVAAGVLSSRR